MINFISYFAVILYRNYVINIKIRSGCFEVLCQLISKHNYFMFLMSFTTF